MEPASLMLIVFVAGVSFGLVSVVVDLGKTRNHKYYPIPVGRCRRNLNATPAQLLAAVEGAVGNPPPHITYPLKLCKWHLLSRDNTCCKAELSLRRGKYAGLSMRYCWTIVPVSGEALQSFEDSPTEPVEWVVNLECTANEGPCSPLAEQISYQLQTFTESLIDVLNKRKSATTPLSGPRASVLNQFQQSYLSRRNFDQSPAPVVESHGIQRWPAAQDYNEAVQCASHSFADFDLRYGTPELDALGLPKAASGSFASVYRIKCHRLDYAVRCFLHPVKDQEYRYQEISKYICCDDLSYTVDLEYLAEGIRIGSRSFPVLKMEWVEGIPFDSYIEQKLRRAESLRPILESFRLMTRALYDAGVAHGDLQHGNIIVRNDELVLVDYDGMFVPELSGSTSHELGHPAYQLPNRSKDHFGPFLDNFSAMVIDTSIFALMLDPELWRKSGAGDDCLLFRRRDFLNPATSTVFSLLSTHKERKIRERANHLASFLSLDPAEVPALNADGTFLPPQRAKAEGVRRTNALPRWLSDENDRQSW